MSSAEIKPSGQEKGFSNRKMLEVLIILFFVVVALPFIVRTVILIFRPTIENPLPTLNDPDVIKPETVTDVQLLSHWGNGTFNSISWSPGGRYFAIGATLGVNLYDGQTFQLLRYIGLPLRNIGRLAFSPDGNLLAVATEWNILLIDITDDKILGQWDMGKSVIALTYLEDGTLVCVTGAQSGGDKPEIQKLVNERWDLVKILDEDFLVDAVFVPEKQAFMVYYWDSVRLFYPISGKEEILPDNILFSGDLILTQDYLLTVDRDRNLISSYTDGHLQNSIDLADAIDQPLASPDGSLLAAIGPNPNNVQGDALTLWKIPELEQIRTIWVPDMSSYVYNEIAFSPTGNRLALLVSPSVVKIFPTAENNTSEIVINDPFSSIVDIGITPDGEIRGVSCSGTALDILKLPSAISLDEWYFDEPTCGQLLDDGKSVVITEPYEPIYLYKVGKSTSPEIVKGSTFSFDGSVGASSGDVASSGDPVTVTIWQKKFNLTQKWNFYDEGHQAFNIAISPSGNLVASTSRDSTHLWVNGIKSGRQYPTLTFKISFSPDEKYLASVNGILELETGRLTTTEKEDDLEYYPEPSIPAFSPDEQILAAELDGTLRFWQVSDGALLAKLDDPGLSTKELIFSSDGTLLVGLGEGFVNVWGISNVE
jgi:WD40 repeat protein